MEKTYINIQNINQQISDKYQEHEIQIQKKRDSHKNYFILKESIYKYKKIIENNNILIQKTINTPNIQKQTGKTIMDLLNENESVEGNIQNIQKSLEFNIIEYLKELDIINRKILSDITLLKNKKNQLEYLTNLERNKLRGEGKLNAKNKTTQFILHRNTMEINRKIDDIELKNIEITRMEDETKNNYSDIIKTNQKYLDNLVKKEELQIRKINSDFIKIDEEYNNNKDVINELIKNEMKIIHETNNKLNKKILELDREKTNLTAFNKILTKKITKLNKNITRNKKLEFKQTTNIVNC